MKSSMKTARHGKGSNREEAGKGLNWNVDVERVFECV